MFGTISDELEVKAAASEAWKIYGTLRLAEITREDLKEMIQKFEVIEGDGGAGTVLLFTFVPGPSGTSSQLKQKYAVVDNEKRVKVIELIEGEYRHGFDMVRVRLEVIEKQKQREGEEESCIIKSTVEYETKDLEVAQRGVTYIKDFSDNMKAVANHLTKNKSNN